MLQTSKLSKNSSPLTFFLFSSETCYELPLGNQSWKLGHKMNRHKYNPTIIPMKNATYLFDWFDNEHIDYVTHDWIDDVDTPNSSSDGICGVRLSDKELLLIGGEGLYSRRLIKFNTLDSNWHLMSSKLSIGRTRHSCVYFHKKIITSGGVDDDGKVIASTEIIDISGNEWTIRHGGNLNQARYYFGMATISLNGSASLIAFGGHSKNAMNEEPLDSIEIWDDTKESWFPAINLTLSRPKGEFGYISLPTKTLCP